MIQVEGSLSVEFDFCMISNNKLWNASEIHDNKYDDQALFRINDSQGVIVKNCTLEKNELPYFATKANSFDWKDSNKLVSNSFTKGNYRE